MKKILGFLLLIIGGFITIALFSKIPSTIEKLKDTSKIEAEDPNSYIIGVIIAGVLLLIIAMAALYFGFQMLKRVKQKAAIEKAAKAAAAKQMINSSEKDS
ncbi:hypothetical protein [uncultured Kordia sp.]|uniref:hypothetical protein n=1 Tax=uncultured Kordia sp. TaxID=507699 RepID=UPI0026370D45|nr:hypothetical protein [uncultured Kordia sp.]